MTGFSSLGQGALGQGGSEPLFPREGFLDAHEQGADGFAAAIVVGIVGALAAGEAGADTAAFVGEPIVAGQFAVAEEGFDTASLAGLVTVDGALEVTEAGFDVAAAIGTVSVEGVLSVTEAGYDSASLAGVVIVEGSLDAHEIGADTALFIGDVETARMAAVEEGEDGADLSGVVIVAGSAGAQESTFDVAAFTVDGVVTGHFAVVEEGADQASFVGGPVVSGALATTEPYGLDQAAFTGDSSAFVPRDPALGLIHLVEIDAIHRQTQEVVTFRFGTKAFTTEPTDDPPNAYYEDGLKTPGDYSRALFSPGRTTGIGDVGAGLIEIHNPDGRLDDWDEYAFDGRRIRIISMERRNPVYSRALPLFDGTMEQATFTWKQVTILIRDRLAELDKPLQETLYAGTTTSGAMNEAEGGPDDLKGRPKPNAYGQPRNVPAIEANPYEHTYDIGINGLDDIAVVRDRGVPLTFSGNTYTTIAALHSASIPSGQYARQLNEGRIRLGSAPAGQITVDPIKGANAAARTAAQVARQILIDMGMVEDVNFLASDVAELDALNDAVVGLWTGDREMTGLEAVGRVLSSIGASISPDRLGVFRMLRHDVPVGDPVITLGVNDMIDRGSGIERDRTGDQGRGVPTWRVNVNYGFNHAVVTANELDVATTEAFRTFAAQEWRTAVAEDETVKDVHLLSPEMTIDTLLINEADAQAEADRLLAMHKVPRVLFNVPVKSILIERVDLGDEVRLQMPRFGLDNGRDFRVIGMEENFRTNTTVLQLWG